MAKVNFPHFLVTGLLVLFLVLFPHFVPLPFYSYSLVCLAVILIFLKTQKQNLTHLGLKRGGLTLHALLIGILSALLWIVFNKWMYHPFITYFFKVPPYTEYDFIRKSTSRLMLTIIAAWLVGGFYEEIVFRGFIQKTIQGWLRGLRSPFWISGLLTSLIFGLYHFQQGVFGIIPAALGGLLWTFLLWRYKGNLWYPVLSHAIYDTIALIMIYYHIVI